MRIKITIIGVDDSYYWYHVSKDKKSILDFLRKYDHEGSNISLDILVEEPEEIYGWLELEPRTKFATDENVFSSAKEIIEKRKDLYKKLDN